MAELKIAQPQAALQRDWLVRRLMTRTLPCLPACQPVFSMGTDERKPTAPTTPATCTVVGLPVRQHGKLVGPTAKLWASDRRVHANGDHWAWGRSLMYRGKKDQI